jgi:hypothetical protein
MLRCNEDLFPLFAQQLGEFLVFAALDVASVAQER